MRRSVIFLLVLGRRRFFECCRVLFFWWTDSIKVSYEWSWDDYRNKITTENLTAFSIRDWDARKGKFGVLVGRMGDWHFDHLHTYTNRIPVEETSSTSQFFELHTSVEEGFLNLTIAEVKTVYAGPNHGLRAADFPPGAQRHGFRSPRSALRVATTTSEVRSQLKYHISLAI